MEKKRKWKFALLVILLSIIFSLGTTILCFELIYGKRIREIYQIAVRIENQVVPKHQKP